MPLDLHTGFAIFLYGFQLETALLTKLVLTDAADAERFVFSLSLSLAYLFNITMQPTYGLSMLMFGQSIKTSRTTSSKITI
jgi:hypothetical protein